MWVTNYNHPLALAFAEELIERKANLAHASRVLARFGRVGGAGR
jgi:hypothetical protein